MASELPSGTVTLLFTDIEGSTDLVKQLGAGYADVDAEHRRIMRAAFEAHGGREVDTQGDSFFAAFRRARDAVAAAVDAQRELAAHGWPPGATVRVRMGLHTGEPHVGEDRYVGIGVNRAARIGAAAHGGQVLLSRTTRDLAEGELPAGVSIRDLGERRLKDVDEPERLYQLVIDGQQSEFGELRTLDVELARKRRRRYAGTALLAVLAVAAAVAVFALGQGSDAGVNVDANSVAVIDPDSNTVVDSVPVGVAPSAVIVGDGSVWVANTADQTVSRIDERTRQLLRTIPVNEYPSDLAVTPGSVWVALGGAALRTEVRRIAVERDEAAETVPAAPPFVGGTSGQLCSRSASSLAAGGGALWFACNNGGYTSEASRIDARAATAARLEQALISSSPAAVVLSDVAFGLGSAWLTDLGANGVTQIRGDSLDKVRQVTVGRAPQAVAVGFGSVWVANGDDDTVSRVDVGGAVAPATVETIPVGDHPVDVAVGDGAIWVVNGGDRSISRIDPATNEVVATVSLEYEPQRVAAGEGAVWVTVQNPTDD